jgi:predicted site-specific integrase-resolvase
MMGLLSSGPVYAPTAGKTKLLKLRDVCGLAGVHENTIRRATDNGNLLCLRLPSGARRFRIEDVERWLGVARDNIAADVEKPARVPVAATIRVSPHGQGARNTSSDKSSLEHQEERVRSFIAARFGQTAEVTWYNSVGSGLDFNRPAFLRLVEDVLAGKYSGGYIVAQDFTRVCRFGIRLVEHLAKLGNCQILYTMSENEAEAKGQAERLTDEILSILTHYTAKASGAKTKGILQVRVPPSTLTRIFELHKLGHSHRQISRILASEGIGKGDCGKTISRNVVTRLLRENRASLEKLLPECASPALTNSLARFVGSKLRLAEGTKLTFKTLHAAYMAWCERSKEQPILSHNKLVRAVLLAYPTVQSQTQSGGHRVYLNLSLLK